MSGVVIGVGNPDRGDDAVGLAVARAVRALAPRCPVVTVASPTQLLDAWDGCDTAVVVDAVRTGGRAGAVTARVLGARPLPVQCGGGGTHGFGVAEAVALAGALGRLPRRLVLVGVEADGFGVGEGLTPAVAAAVPNAARVAVQALSGGRRGAARR